MEHETQHQLIQIVKGTEIVSDDRVPGITLNSAMGRPEGFSAEKGDYSTGTITLTIRFWVESSNRDAGPAQNLSTYGLSCTRVCRKHLSRSSKGKSNATDTAGAQC
ncbi:MAG: hypothetical protein ACXVBU_18800 [Ktedonobacteraceae bacterium]